MPVYRVPVELTWNGAGSPGVNVWHMRGDTVPGTADQDAIDHLRTFYNELLTIGEGTQSFFASGMTAELGQVVDVESDEVKQFDWTTVVGKGSASNAPPATQLCISWRTSIAAARGHGRTFLGPLGAAAVASDGTPTSTFLSQVRSSAGDLVDWSTGNAGSSWAIYGYQSKGGPGRVARDITGFSVRNMFAVLRSRRD